MAVDLAAGAALQLGPTESARAWDGVRALLGPVDLARCSEEEMVELAAAVPGRLPDGLLRAVHAYRCRADSGDVLLVRGLLPSGARPGPTPPASAAALDGADVQVAALLLLGVALLLGEPFAYRTLYRGQLVQNVVPVPGMEHTQTGESSRGSLDWHVEDGFSPDRCDYFGLLCLTGDSEAATEHASARDLRLSDEDRDVLRAPRFEMLPDSAHVLAEVRPVRTAVLTGPRHVEELCFDAHYLRPAGDDAEAAAALVRLRSELDRVRASVVLDRGDLLLLDNRRIAHARSPFRARHDGSDRWLLRTMICSSLPRYRRLGTRVIG